MSSPELILASGSPRRKQLLEAAGYQFRVVSPHEGAEEAGLCSNCGPAELVRDLAILKWKDVDAQLEAAGTAAGEAALLLAADTVAECGGQVLGKPVDEEHARAMLTELSGCEHRVFTGICLGVSGAVVTLHSEVVTTTLRMAPLDEGWIEKYLATGLWEGKAGAFGYQDGLGFVTIIEGSETNVVGLPMERVAGLLEQWNCRPV